MKHLIFIALLIPIILNGQEPKPGNLSPMLEKGGSVYLAKDWKYNVGDNPEWAKPDFDDSEWQTFTNGNLYNEEIQKKAKKTNIVWYRKKISIDSTTTQKLVIAIFQSGASEIYLDGELIHSLGKVSNNANSIVRINQAPVQLSFPLKINKEQVLTIRFADAKSKWPLFQEQPGYLQVHVRNEDFAKGYVFASSDSLFNDNGFLNLGYAIGWRFHPGDDPNWSKPDFDDSEWYYYKPSILAEPIPDSLWQGYGWFRMRFTADSSVYAQTTQLYFETLGAAEVYLDGKLIKKCGIFSTELQGEKRYPVYGNIFNSLCLQYRESHVLAVRYSYHKGQTYKKLLGKYAGRFGFGIGLATDELNKIRISEINNTWQFVYILGTMLLLIVLLHGFLYLLFPTDRSNLYIAIVAFLLFSHIVVTYLYRFFELNILQLRLLSDIPYIILFLAALSLFPLTISSMFNQKTLLMYKILIWLFPVFALANFILSGPEPNPVIAFIFPSIIIFYSSHILIKAWKNKQKGVWFVAAGFLGLIVSTVAVVFYNKYSQDYKYEISLILSYLIYASVPLGLTAFMASRFRDLYTNLEQKVRERTRELNQSLEELRSTQSQLIQSEKMASLGQLTAGIAHEIQNPLNFVNNFSEVNAELIDEMDEAIENVNLEEIKVIAKDIKENEQKIHHHGKRAESIVKGMLLHSRGNSGHKEPVDINALCDEYLRLSYHGFRAKDKSLPDGQAGFNAEYKTELDPNLPKINVVPQDIGRVLLNLINNAFYACTEQSKLFQSSELWKSYQPLVTVSTIKLDDKIQISVMDNGPGIPPEIKDKIFQPFFTTKPTGQGTGLGLSLAYDIVKAHGGEIRVESKEGEGSEFIINLPVT